MDFSSIIVSAGGFFWGRKQAEVYSFATKTYFPLPFTATMQRNALEFALVVRPSMPVIRAFKISTVAKVSLTIVERIAVLVVAFLSKFCFEYFGVHPNVGTPISPSGIEALGILVPLRKPIPLGEPFKILGIHDGILPLRK